MQVVNYVDVRGYEGLYAATTDGKIFSYPRVFSNRKEDGFLRQEKTKNGYRRVTFYKDGKKSRRLVHRVIADTFIEENGKPQINHINGIKHDNRVENLERVTQSENAIHAHKNGLIKISDKQRMLARKLGLSKRKISIDDASEICEAFETRMFSCREIGDFFSVTPQAIRAMIKTARI